MNNNNSFNPNDSTKANQRQALLDHLEQHGKVSTIESRDRLGVLNVAARMLELRRQGFQIETRRVLEADAGGRLHGVALYVLKATTKQHGGIEK